MKITHLAIHNYRSVQHVELEVPEMLVLLGPNNHGKSNILNALEFGLSTSAKPESSDFCAFRDSGDSTLWVEMTFAGLTAQEKVTFKKYVRNDDTVRIRKTATLDQSGGVSVTYRGYVQEPEEWWLKGSGLEKLATKDQVEKAAKDVPELQAALEGGGRFSKQRVQDFQQSYIEAHKADLKFSEVLEDGPLLGTKNVAGGVLPDFYLVPAIRDLSDETKTKGTSVFSRLLQRAVQEMAERDPGFAAVRKQLNELIAQLNTREQAKGQSPSQIAQLESALAGELGFWGVAVSIEVTPPEIEKILELGTQLHLDDGLKTLAERKGHGLQRAVIFALLRAWAKAVRPTAEEGAEAPRKASECAYFAIEEPELFLHPHAQRQLFQALKDLAASAEHQVFLCTHSTHFVDLDQYKSITICYKRDARSGTEARQCIEELFTGEDARDRKNRFHMAAWVNPDRGELFFAKRVILVEGETEKALLPFLAKTLGRFDPDVSVIDCGSKFNLALYIRILNAFRIPYLVIHDEDPLPDPIPGDWPDDKRKARRKVFNENTAIQEHVDPALGAIEVLSPDFEGVSGVSRTQAEKKGKPIAALDHFSTVPPGAVPKRLAEVLEKAYRG